MAINTKIQWCDDTVNPAMGCSGCELWEVCYAHLLHKRWPNHPGFSPDFSIVKLFPGRMAAAASLSNLIGKRRTDKPWLDNFPRTIFVSDMGDALSEGAVIDKENKPLPEKGVAFWYLKKEIIDVVTTTQGKRHIWQWLTKRPHRMREFSEWLINEHSQAWPPNLWAGTSITTNGTLSRINHLMQVGDENTVRFISVEPLWEEVSLARYLRQPRMNWWIIVGGESKQKGKPHEFKLEWARKLRDECAEFGVPYFLKQTGFNVTEKGKTFPHKDGHGGNWDEWPEDLRIRQMPPCWNGLSRNSITRGESATNKLPEELSDQLDELPDSVIEEIRISINKEVIVLSFPVTCHHLGPDFLNIAISMGLPMKPDSGRICYLASELSIPHAIYVQPIGKKAMDITLIVNPTAQSMSVNNILRSILLLCINYRSASVLRSLTEKVPVATTSGKPVQAGPHRKTCTAAVRSHSEPTTSNTSIVSGTDIKSKKIFDENVADASQVTDQKGWGKQSAASEKSTGSNLEQKTDGRKGKGRY